MEDKRTISVETLKKIEDKLPQKIVEMLPDTPANLLKYAKRIIKINFAPNINNDTRKMMQDYLLSDEEYLTTFYYVMAISFFNKTPVKEPNLTIVTAQTGSGKSNLTAKILRENDNYVFIDSDKYKHYRYDAIEISKNYPLLYPFLTGPDAYDHADNIYEYALENKYNIIKETAPSKNKGLLGVDVEKLKKENYTISLNILAVSNLNSLLSMHERYELQIISGLKTAKLTGIARHNESYDALIPKINEMIDNSDIDFIRLYKRGNITENFNPILMYTNNDNNNSIEEIINLIRKEDYKNTLKDFNERYNLIMKQMNDRNAPKEQINQLQEIKDNYIY